MDQTSPPDLRSIPTVDEIVARMTPPPKADERDLIERAYAFAREAHEGQRRKSGDPFFIHVAIVARMLAGWTGDPPTIAAGLLHDTVEDCEIALDRLRALFGAETAELVDGVTKISAIHFGSEQENQAGNLRKMILAMARDVRVVLIKLCDRLHNMHTLDPLSPTRRRAIAQATLDIYAPLANRLGMTRVRAELEDLSMRYLHPSVYRNLASRMAVREQADQSIVDRTRALLSEHLKHQNIPATIKGRRKHLYSLHRKMQRQGLRFDEVHDILAVRVVTDTMAECYEILGVVHNLWKPIVGRFHDYIATPKPNGYRSIHTSVIGPDKRMIEIQIRTHEMHRIAEDGIAAHWRYKETGASDATPRPHAAHDDQQRLAWLRQLVDWLQDVRDPSEFVSELKRDVFESSVFCYTPRGDIIELPRGATAIDLAYRIHTDLGHRCAGVRLNQRMGSIREHIQTGDIVEIQTSKTAHPTLDWLQIAQTGRARSKIRHWLKEHQREEFLERGRRMLLDHAHSRFGAHLDEARIATILGDALDTLRVASWDDLLIELGCGTIRIGSLIGRLDRTLRPEVAAPKRAPRAVRRRRKKKDVILVEGLSGAVTRLAQCCSPLPGDSIVGFITQGKGISVHRADCASLESIRRRAHNFESRLVHVEWDDAGRQLQRAAIRLVCQDRKDLINDVTAAVGQLGIHISQINANARGNRTLIRLVVLIEDGTQLNTLLNRLQTIPAVHSLSRVVRRG